MFLFPCVLALGALAQEPPVLPSFTITTQVLELPEGTKVTRENAALLPDAKVLLKPTLRTLSGNEAKMFIGDEIKYAIDAKTTGVAHTGWSITATATEDKDGLIRLAFRPEWSHVTRWHQKLPEISTRFVDTKSLLKSGERVLVPFGKGDNKTHLYALVMVERNE